MRALAIPLEPVSSAEGQSTNVSNRQPFPHLRSISRNAPRRWLAFSAAISGIGRTKTRPNWMFGLHRRSRIASPIVQAETAWKTHAQRLAALRTPRAASQKRAYASCEVPYKILAAFAIVLAIVLIGSGTLYFAMAISCEADLHDGCGRASKRLRLPTVRASNSDTDTVLRMKSADRRNR